MNSSSSIELYTTEHGANTSPYTDLHHNLHKTDDYTNTDTLLPLQNVADNDTELLQVLAHGQTAANQGASQPASQPINQPGSNGGLGTFQGLGPRVELGGVQQQMPVNAHYAANPSLESSTSQPFSQPSVQSTSQSTGQGMSAHWDNINQAYGQARQAGSWKVPGRVGPPLRRCDSGQRGH